MPPPFHLIAATAAGGRRARLDLPHATVKTPVFMPVGTAGSVKAVAQDVLESLGAEIILGNTYHLYLRPGHEAIRRMGGLHKFMSWPRALLTDSGGFQVFSLNSLRKVTEDGVQFRSHLDGSSHSFTPEHSVEVQIALGADICMSFDECTEYPASRARAEESLRLTMAWARRSLDHFRAHKHEVPWHDQPQHENDFVAPASSPAVVRASPPALQPQTVDSAGSGLPPVPRTWGPGSAPPTPEVDLGPNPCSASSRVACIVTSAASAPSVSSRWISTATPSAALAWASPAN